MAVHYRTQAVILKKEDIGEADRIFTVFSERYGKIRLRAVSERKITSKLRGGLEHCAISDIEFIQGKSAKTITDACFVYQLSGVKENLFLLKTAYRICEVADALLAHEEKNDRIWNVLCEALKILEHRTDIQARVLLHATFWKLISLEGYTPLTKDLKHASFRVNRMVEYLMGAPFAELLEDKEMCSLIGQGALKEVSQHHLLQVIKSW